MPPTDDSALLRQYVENRSDEAFAALVTRHINLVYSVAVRCVGDPHQAEEVAQAVFILLAKKAAQLRHDKALSSWLFQATRLTASNFVRGETRRHRREQEAHMQSVLNDPGSDVWPRIAPLLDDAVAGLNEKDRDAIVLRFYEGRSLREVGAALGASEAAAEKRVSRAVERLREFFTKRGITVAASGLVVIVSANAVQAAPAGLAATLTTASLASAAAGTGTTLTLLKFMAMTKLKLTVAAALLAVVLTPVIVWQVNEYRLRNVCEVDLRNAGQMKDVISNVLLRAEPKPESEVAAFLKDAERRYATGDDLLKAAAEHFKIDHKRLAALVEHWRHINCKHAAIPGYAVPDAGREATTGETWAQEAAPLPPQIVAEPKPQPPATPQCEVNLKKAGQMEDVLSNVLLRAEHKPASEVQAFVKDVQSRYATGDNLLKAAAEHFKIDHKRLAALVEHWRHINCKHAAIPGYAVPDAGREATTGETLAPRCKADLRNAGGMKDKISNVLLRAEHKPASEVAAFLKDAERRFATGDDLLKAAAEHFKIDQKRLAALVEHWRHINCRHEAIPGYAVSDREPLLDPVPFSVFAADVTLHVVLHELGHAVMREFDLMVLGNEETMADAFATHLLTEHFPEHAVRAISARVKSLMIEANEVPRDQWPVRGEHDNDARRAYQIAALAIAADKEKYAGVAEIVGMSERNIVKACDYGSEIHQAWRRTLSPLMMPAGKVSKLALLRADESTRAFVDAGKPSLASTITNASQRFNWPSQVTVDFVWGSGAAGWNRDKRTVTVNSEYLQRFIAQGVKAEAQVAPRDLDRR